MGHGLAIEAEGPGPEVGEFTGVDARAHQAIRRVRVSGEKIVADLVCHGPAEHDTQHVLSHRGEIVQPQFLVLIDDAEGRQAMGTAGRSKAKADFDQQRVIDTTLATYDRLVRAKKRPLPI